MKPTGEVIVFSEPHQLDSFINLITDEWKRGKKPAFQRMSDDRTLSQNSAFWALYRQIGKQVGSSPTTIQRICKLHYGVGIRKAIDQEFADLYDAAIKPQPYELKLLLMDSLRVTSTFSKEVASEYIDAIIEAYSTSGIHLSRPQ